MRWVKALAITTYKSVSLVRTVHTVWMDKPPSLLINFPSNILTLFLTAGRWVRVVYSHRALVIQ